MSKTTTLGQLEKVAQRAHDRAAALEAQINNIKPDEYLLAKQATAEEGYLATYYLTKGGTQVGEKINIPKDVLVQEAHVAPVGQPDAPYSGAVPGDKYIDFTLASKDMRFRGIEKTYRTGVSAAIIIISGIPAADMQTDFRLRVGNIRVAVKVQETLETDEVIWNDEAKTDCTVCVTTKDFFGIPRTTGSLARALTNVAAGKGVPSDEFRVAVTSSSDGIHINVSGEMSNSDCTFPMDILFGDAEHLFLPVKDLVDVYTGGSGVEISYKRAEIKLDAANSNGLSVTADGLQLAAVTTSAAGAMSAEDKAKLDETVLATDAEIENMLNNIFGTPEVKVPEDLLAGPSEPEPIH